MSFKTKVKAASPDFLVHGYRDVSSSLTLLTSRNKRFLRFAPPGHFYSPIPDIDDINSPAIRANGRVESIPGVRLNERGQLDRAEEFAKNYPDMPFPEQAAPGLRYHLDNQWFSYGDGVVLYSMMRDLKPRRIIEVGSGFSSAAMLDVNDRFFDGKIELTFIEPYPKRLRGVLGGADTAHYTILEAPVQDAPMECFGKLEANDILFIDSSHVGKVGSDVLHLLFNVLPTLAPGVVVHFHDIPWPFEYPHTWLEQGRAWNEAYFLRSFLQYNTSFEIAYFNSFLATNHATAISGLMPLAMRRPSAELTEGNSSIWIVKQAQAG